MSTTDFADCDRCKSRGSIEHGVCQVCLADEPTVGQVITLRLPTRRRVDPLHPAFHQRRLRLVRGDG